MHRFVSLPAPKSPTRFHEDPFFESLPSRPNAAKDATPPLDYVTGFLATSEGLALVKAFMQIKKPKLRRRIVDLVRQNAGDDD